jgi:hypothetical protein
MKGKLLIAVIMVSILCGAIGFAEVIYLPADDSPTAAEQFMDGYERGQQNRRAHERHEWARRRHEAQYGRPTGGCASR